MTTYLGFTAAQMGTVLLIAKSIDFCCSLMAGGIVYAAVTNPGEPGTYVKLAVILLMVLLTNPVSNHTLCRASYKMKVLPTTKLIIDDYKEDDPQ